MKQLLSSLIVIFLFSGCASTIESFYNRQVIEDEMVTEKSAEQHIGTLAVTAQRRIIVGNLKTGNFCSEPPPEIADSITTAIAAALKANISSDKNVSAELASNFARHINQLYKRSHTVQIFRDASYHLCVNAVNSSNAGTNSYQSYKIDIKGLVGMLIPSLDKEVALYYETEKIRAKNPPEINSETIVCDSSVSIGESSDGGGQNITSNIKCKPLSGSE